MDNRVTELSNRLAKLDSDFQYWLAAYKDVTSYILPRRGLYLDKGLPTSVDPKGRQSELYDSTATRANRSAGAGMQGGLASPSRPWFRFGLFDPDLETFGPHKEWLDRVERIIYRILAGSNFYTQVHTCFEEQAGFGTCPVFMEEDLQDVVRFRVFTAGEYRLAASERGVVDTIFRPMWLPVRNVAAKFGEDALSTASKAILKTSPYSLIKVVHAIMPREERDPFKKDSRNMAFASYWYEPGGDRGAGNMLGEFGYREFPAAVPRWNTLGPIPYGMGPGFDALGDAKMLQQMQKAKIKALHKMVDPPLAIDGKYKGIIDITPGAANVGVAPGSVGPLMETRVPLQELEASISETRQQIERNYYVDLFLMVASADSSNREMTATEVVERHEEKLLLLGPTIERQIHELLDPVLTRTFNLANEAGILPPPPESLQGTQLKVEYISLLAQAQKMVTSQSMNAYMQMAERVFAINPESILKTNWDAFLEKFADVIGLPAKTLNDDDTVLALKQQIQAQQQAMAQAEQAALGARTAKDLSQASTTGDNALAELRRSVES